MAIDVDESDVHDILDDDSSADYSIEVRMAEEIVNDELAPYSDKTDRLEFVGELIAAAYAKDDGDGNLSSVTQGSAQISWNNDAALSFWDRAVQMDPTGRLGSLEGDDFWCIAL
jgi:hypothetical protein